MSGPLAPSRLIRLDCPIDALRVEIAPGEPPAPSAEMLARWEIAARANPRLFNGPILRLDSFDGASRALRASRETYQRYAMQVARPSRHRADAADMRDGIVHLAVTGLVCARDRRGRAHVLLGRRGESTYLYPGMLELAPGGGLDAPASDARVIDAPMIVADLLREMREELGGLADAPRRPWDERAVVGVALDPNTPSADILIRVELDAPVESLGAMSRAGPHAWEYGQLRWLAFDDAPALLADPASGLIPPTRAAIEAIVAEGPGAHGRRSPVT